MSDTKTHNKWGTNRQGRRDRNRRRRWFTQVHNCKTLTRGQKATAMGLAERSSDTAKPVFGNQIGFGADIGCSDRQFRSDVKALEREGIVKVTRFDAEHDEEGKWYRKTNVYVFCVPPATLNRKKPSSVLKETDFPTNLHPTDGDKTLRQRRHGFDPNCPDCDQGLVEIPNLAVLTFKRCHCNP